MKKPVQIALFTIVLGLTALTPVQAQEDLAYVAVEPCRIVDTRNSGGAIPTNNFRNFRVSGTSGELAAQGGITDCLGPKAGTGLEPLAISAYVIAVPIADSGSGVLSAYPSDKLPPPVGSGSTVNFSAQQIIGNTTNITLCDPSGSCPADGEFAVLARETNQHVVIDVQGYFYPMQGGPVYVKSNGENIGVVVSSTGPVFGRTATITALSSKEYLFSIDLLGQHYGYYVSYQSANCTGQAYANTQYEQSISAPASVYRVMGRSDVYYIPKNTPSALTLVASYFNNDGDCSAFTPREDWYVPVFPNDPAITGVQNSYATPITEGY